MPSLFEHLPGCTPLKPCASCEFVRFLKEKLSPEDFRKMAELAHRIGEAAEPTTATRDADDADLGKSVDDLEISARVRNVLKGADLRTIRQVLEWTEQDLRRLPNFGRKMLADLQLGLARIGRHIGELAPPAT